MTKRAREALEVFNRHPGELVSLNIVGDEDFALAYTFRNGVAELRREGYDIRYIAKEKGYRMLSLPPLPVPF